VAEEEIDLATAHETLVALDKQIREATKRHNQFLRELDVPLLS